MRFIDWLMLITLSILWGGSFFFVGVAVKELPPLTIITLRVVIAALALLLFLQVTGRALPLRREVTVAFFGMGLLNNVIPFFLIAWAQGQIESGLASIFNATMPLFTVVVAHFLTADEKLTSLRIAGVVLGIAGVTAMIGPELLSSGSNNTIAQIAILAAALSYALASIYGRRFKTLGVSPIATATGQVSASSLMLIPLVLLVDQPWTLPMPSLETWAAVVALAILATSLAYILYFRILASSGATNLSLVTFLIPVSAIILGALFLNETLQMKHFIGMALIGAGLAAIDGRIARVFGR
ncbi:Permease of the drug/metabolite transporter (DMT) superfamily [hydrothermal vent metagenome]|uniref:Permease of the drug/metabolite transporter (DMT) superfamily n=1 Tax=hydrothermal vent metagenome TaxID=652676 RepID=A0A3B0SAQ6_9ZZZZ